MDIIYGTKHLFICDQLQLQLQVQVQVSCASEPLCQIQNHGKILIITDLGEAESESIPLKIRYDQIFFYDPAQRHRDHREKQSLRVLCGFVRDFF